jgi:hypothetical protein
MKLFIEELVRAFTLYPLKNSIFKKLEEIINEVQELFEYESKGEHKQKYSHINRSKNFWEEIWKKIEKNCTEFDKIFKEIQKNYSDEKEKGIINKKITPLIKSLEEKLKFFEEIRTTAFTFFSPVQS